MENEVWKDIPNYEGIYKASNFGRIKMVKRTLIDSLGKKINKKEHILKPRTGNRYYMIALYKNGKKKRQPKWFFEALKNAKTPEERSILRSKTFPGIAKAMAEQWTNEDRLNNLGDDDCE